MFDGLDKIMNSGRMKAAAEASLKVRRLRHQPMVYQRGEWMVLECGDGRIQPIVKVGEFKAEQILAKLQVSLRRE